MYYVLSKVLGVENITISKWVLLIKKLWKDNVPTGDWLGELIIGLLHGN